jgi:hypothetical protein
VANRIIKINRGDSYEFEVAIPDQKNIDPETTVTDIIYFALVYPHQRFEDAILTNGYDYTDYVVEDGEAKIIIKVEPKDTVLLAPGIYYYTVKLYRTIQTVVNGHFEAKEEVKTLIERTKFIINE